MRVTSEKCTVPAIRIWQPTPQRTTPAPVLHQSTLRRMRHFCSAGLPPQWLVELQFRGRLCIDTCIVQQPIVPGFRCQVCRMLCSVNIHFIRTSSGRGVRHFYLRESASGALGRSSYFHSSLKADPASPPPFLSPTRGW